MEEEELGLLPHDEIDDGDGRDREEVGPDLGDGRTPAVGAAGESAVEDHGQDHGESELTERLDEEELAWLAFTAEK